MAGDDFVVKEFERQDRVALGVGRAARGGWHVLHPQAPHHSRVPHAQGRINGEHRLVVHATIEAATTCELPLVRAQAGDASAVPEELRTQLARAQVPHLDRVVSRPREDELRAMAVGRAC
eukprot:CAMPEP_0185541338 /NCGR_PEP_ID=MMETSP1381-20130426/1903_1 /TAXON_ID=298111 /ORGANISM="Pavlova sp., Strain CCMP459" /LENGTH=119 /DNA_ID=CAMNT_0028153241 /DNA_START=227 /DNA_END=583 /DNA_ORIENTATION=+